LHHASSAVARSGLLTAEFVKDKLRWKASIGRVMVGADDRD